MSASSRQRLLRNLTLRSLRRNLGSTVVLVLFVLLSALLASAASGLLITGTGAAASLMNQARTPHFLQMHDGELDSVRFEQFAQNSPLVAQYEAVAMLNFDGTDLRIGERTLAEGLQDNSLVPQSALFDFLLDTNGEIIEPEPGTVWLPLYYMELLDLEAGQAMTVQGSNGAMDLEIAGFLRDSQMNSSYASSKRLLVNGEDLARLKELGGSIEYLLQFRLHDPGMVAEFEAAYRAAGLEASGPAVTWSLFQLINSLSAGITAAIVILVTLLLVAIAILCVRFILLSTIEQEYREIGVLKAVGVTAGQLRRLYGRRYLALALSGAAAGFALSPLLTRLLLRDIELYMGPAGRTLPALAAGVVLSLLIVGAVMLAVQRTLSRLEAVSPVQAIRTGLSTSSGGRQVSTPAVLAGGGSVNIRLGVRDVLNRAGLYTVPFVIFSLAAFILVVPQNLLSTVTRPDFITYMGAGVSDMRIDVTRSVAALGRLEVELASDPEINSHIILSTAAYSVRDTAGQEHSLKIESGDHAAVQLSYLQGTPPLESNQIALSRLQADDLGVVVGDTLEISGAVFTVSGLYQDLTNGGKTAKISAQHTSEDLIWSTIYADFTAGTDVQEAISRYAADWPDLKISSVSAYVGAIMGGTVEALQGASLASLLVGLAIAALVTALFMPLLLARDAFQVAIMRAIGFRMVHIQRQYVTRALLILVPGIIIGAVLANLLGGGLASLFLSSVGLSQLQLVANPWLAYIASPVALLAVVVFTTLLSTRPDSRMALSVVLKD